MQIYQSYVVTKRYRGCGLTNKPMNLPYGEPCHVIVDQGQGYIVCRDRRVCYVDSQTAFDYFSQNDDGNGEKRGELVNKILNRIVKLKQDKIENDRVWNEIWNNNICLKYKRSDNDDHWIWNYDFYNANLFDLYYIASIVGAK